MPKAKETGAASAPAKKTAGRRSYRSYGKIKPAPGKSKAEPKPIKVSFLGGLNEVGKNMTLFEYGEDMFLVDCGLAFPDQDMLGVDLVLPDFTYVERNADRIRGIVITHGHADHIGGLIFSRFSMCPSMARSSLSDSFRGSCVSTDCSIPHHSMSSIPAM